MWFNYPSCFSYLSNRLQAHDFRYSQIFFPLRVTAPITEKRNQAEIRIGLEGQWSIWVLSLVRLNFSREVDIFIFSSQLKRNDKWGQGLFFWSAAMSFTVGFEDNSQKAISATKEMKEAKQIMVSLFLKDANTSGDPRSCWSCSSQHHDFIQQYSLSDAQGSRILLGRENLQF